VNPGTDVTPTTVKMIETGNILSGQIVLISYTAIENFAIIYTTNGLLNDVQEEIDKMKHACADVIVKQAVENKIDFGITVIPKAGITNMSQLTAEIRTAVSNYVSQIGVGVSLTQSDVVHEIKKIDDVDYVVLPFFKMTKADDSFVVSDNLGSPQFEMFNEGLTTAYITTVSVLTYKTTDKGGPENLFRGVFENSLPLILQDSPLEVSEGAGRAYIRSDGKIVVSTRDGQIPDLKSYEVSYYVQGETGSYDINVASVEYLSIGSFSVAYDTPRDLSKQAL